MLHFVSIRGVSACVWRRQRIPKVVQHKELSMSMTKRLVAEGIGTFWLVF
jgi:hypothetical protein